MPKTGLTERQKQIAKKLADEPFKTQALMAEELGTTPGYISRLKARDEFKEYLQYVLDENWKEYGVFARRKMKELAENGDYRAVEFICKTNNLNPAQKIEGEINTNLVIKITGEEETSGTTD